MAMQIQARDGVVIRPEERAALEERFHVNRPVVVQYAYWITDILFHGNFGISFMVGGGGSMGVDGGRPVKDLLAERLFLTMAISIPTLILTYLVAIPTGIYAALRQYSVFDYLLSFVGFFGLAVPGFLLAILAIYLGHKHFDANVGGLFSPQYELAPWSFGKVRDLLSNIWIPIVVVGLGGTTGMVRVMRGMMLDELSQPYVETARAKGLSETKLIYKYPVRLAISPILSTIGYHLPIIVSGEIIVSVVLNLPTIGPLLLNALLNQDTYLAASIILLLSTLTILGTFLSDLILAWVDPRIRYQ
jgi:peptide/nickel transport system permease protein